MDDKKPPKKENNPAKTQPIPIPCSTATVENHAKPPSSEPGSDEDERFPQDDQNRGKNPKRRPALAPFIVESRPGFGQNPDRPDLQLAIKSLTADAESRARAEALAESSKKKKIPDQGSGKQAEQVPSTNKGVVKYAGGSDEKANPIAVEGSSVDKNAPGRSKEPVKGKGEGVVEPSVSKRGKPKLETKIQSKPSAARVEQATNSDGRVTDVKIGEMEDWLVASENPIWPMKGTGTGTGKEKKKEKGEEEGEGKMKEEEKEKEKERGSGRERERERGKEKKKEKAQGKEKGKEKEKGKGKEKGKEKEKEKGKGKGKEKGKEKEKEKEQAR